MSFQNATFEYPKSSKWPAFSGGLVNNTTNTLLADHYSPYLRNARLEGSSIVTRPGHSQFKVLPSTWNGFGISGYLRSNPANDRLIVRHNASATEKLVSYTDAWVATNIQTTYSKTATTIGFTASTPATITDSWNWFITAGFKSGDRITITGSASNNKTVTVNSVAAGVITLVRWETFIVEWAWATVTLTSQRVSVDDKMSFTNIWDDLYCYNGTNFGKLTGTTYIPIAPQISQELTGTTISFSATDNSINVSWWLTFNINVISDTITVIGSANNNGTYEIDSIESTTKIKIKNATLITEWAWASMTLIRRTLPSAPKFGTFFAWCHWVAWTEDTGWSNKLYKSPNNNHSNFYSAWADVFSFPENVTGIVASAQAIFAFTKNTIHTCTIGDQVASNGVLTFSFKSIAATEWANNNSTIVSVGSDVYYMTPTGKINKIQRGYNINGFEIQALSDKPLAGISTLTQNLDEDQSAATAHYYTQESVIKWFVKSKWSAFNDICIVYDVDRQQFLQDTNKPFYDLAFFHWKNYALSQFNPTIFIDEYGTDDDGAGIDFEFWTKSFDEWESTLKKCYWESRTSVDISKLTELTQEVYTDSEVYYNGEFRWTLIDTKTIDIDNIDEASWIGGIGTEPVGTFPIGMEWAPSTVADMYPVDILRTKWDLNKKGNQIAFRYYSNKVWAKVRLKRLWYKREILSGFATQLTN